MFNVHVVFGFPSLELGSLCLDSDLLLIIYQLWEMFNPVEGCFDKCPTSNVNDTKIIFLCSFFHALLHLLCGIVFWRDTTGYSAVNVSLVVVWSLMHSISGIPWKLFGIGHARRLLGSESYFFLLIKRIFWAQGCVLC